MATLLGGVEAGGTKFVCAVGTGEGEIRASTRFPTTTPAETIRLTLEFFRPYRAELAALGIASFGPVDLHRDSPTWGTITTTPKPGWRDADLAGPLVREFGVPVGFDTDVTGAALGEYRWGAARGLDTFIYLTIGTGIGGGALIGGQLLRGLVHPEMGHIRLPRDPARDPFPGSCPFHGDCFEGLAAGPALEKRWGARAETFAADHPAWALEAHYIALALQSYICSFSPQRIIIGGGVMGQTHMWPLVRAETLKLLNGYVQAPDILEKINEYIVPPGLGGQAGVLGAMALGDLALSGKL